MSPRPEQQGSGGRERLDVVVVGAGAVGVSCAYYLAGRGASVRVVEAEAAVGARCSFGNGGVISPTHCVPLANPTALRELPRSLVRGSEGVSVRLRPSLDLLRFGAVFARSSRRGRMLVGLRCLRDLGRRSRELFEELAKDEGLDFDYRPAGLMNVCRGRKAFERLADSAALLEREGLEPEILEGEAVSRREPALREELAGGVYWGEDAQCDPHRFVVELARAAEARGAGFSLETTVEQLARGADGSVTEVRTSRGPIAARSVVVAAGAWTPALVHSLGLRPPLEPARGYHLDFAREPGLRLPVIFEEVVAAATPFDGRLRLVGGMEFAGVDSTFEPARAHRVLDAARSYLRILDGPLLEPASVWSGLRPVSADGLPIVGRSGRAGNVFFATGHGMLGLTLAPVTGLAVAELLVDERSTLPVGPLSPSRFGI